MSTRVDRVIAPLAGPLGSRLTFSLLGFPGCLDLCPALPFGVGNRRRAFSRELPTPTATCTSGCLPTATGFQKIFHELATTFGECRDSRTNASQLRLESLFGMTKTCDQTVKPC